MGRGTLWPDLAKLTYSLIHHGRYNQKRMSEEIKKRYGIKIGKSTINRNAYSFMGTTSELPITLRNLIVYMEAQNDFKVLKTICNYFGFIMSRLPRTARNRKACEEKINDLQSLYSKIIQALIDYKKMPLADNRAHAIRMLLKGTEYETGLIRDLKHNLNQLELPLYASEV